MMKKSKISRIVSLSIALAGFTLASGYLVEANAQSRDPFMKPGYARQRSSRPGGPGHSSKSGSQSSVPSVPSIEQRIDYYKRMRENAAANGMPLPKVTSVLTLNEMAVTGIFRTPRGYAAMVEAMPIKLSYTIYPGEKFFDGQLVAVEENRLVFRKVTKTGQGKFVSSVENKPLRQYTTKEQIQGTAPVQAENGENQTAEVVPAPQTADNKAAPVNIISPLDEMNSKPAESEVQSKPKKPARKPVKVARNKN